ncbi:MAG: preprotein translocase subunit SecG [Pseudomonadota bacterium]
MESVVIVIHLIIALCLIATVLLQRSEGGALGIGGGGGGLVSQRGAASALSRVTWALAIAFICTSIMLTILSGRGSSDGSVVDDFTQPADTLSIPLPGSDGSSLPEGAGDGQGGIGAGSLLPPASPPAAD